MPTRCWHPRGGWSSCYESGGDPKKRARALEVVTRFEPDTARRQKAAKTLAELSDEFKLGTHHALAAWRVLVDSDASDEGLQELQKDCENADDDAGLAEVLELRARRSGDPEQARALAFRSVELTAKAQPDASLARLRGIIERYGPSRESYERMAELLERSSGFEELAQVLDALARLARPQERARIWAKLAKLRLERLADAEGALRAFERSLEIDPAEATSRQSLERMLKKKELRLEAAAILEPIFRAERKTAKLVELLELRAAFADDPHVRLRSLEQAAELVDELGETERGLKLCQLALELSVAHDRQSLRAWLERLQHFADAEPQRVSQILLETLTHGDRLEPELMGFVLQAVESWCKQEARAGAVAARACAERGPELTGAARPHGRDLGQVGRDSVRTHRALFGGCRKRRRRALAEAHAFDRADRALRASLAGCRGRDADAGARQKSAGFATHLALLDVYDALGDSAAFDGELERGLGSFVGSERVITLVRLIERLASQHDTRVAGALHEAAEEPELAPEAFKVAERLSSSPATSRTAPCARTPGRECGDSVQRARALERLGEFFLEQLGNSEAGASAGAAVRARQKNIPIRRSSSTSACSMRFNDAKPPNGWSSSTRRRGVGQRTEVYAVCVRGESSDAKRVELLLTLAPRAADAGAVDVFIELADEVLWRVDRDTPVLGRNLISAKARVLAADGSRHADAAQMFQSLLEAYGEDDDIAAFREFIEKTPDSEVQRKSLRWLFNWRAGAGARSGGGAARMGRGRRAAARAIARGRSASTSESSSVIPASSKRSKRSYASARHQQRAARARSARALA